MTPADFPGRTGCCCLQTGRLGVCDGGLTRYEPCIFCDAGKEIERLEAALKEIRDSTFRNAVTLRGMADRALTGKRK